MSADGRALYFTRFGITISADNVRSYRGGLLSRLWRFNLDGSEEASPIARIGGDNDRVNDRRPMPWKDRIYYISDRDGHDNLWSMALDGGDPRQLTREAEFNIRTASLDRGRIIYQLGADLHVYDIAAGVDRKLAIDLASDFDQRRRHLIKQPLDFFESAALAPDGERVAVTARGRIALMGVGPGRRFDIGTPPAGRAGAAQISPDGRWVYAILPARLKSGASPLMGVQKKNSLPWTTLDIVGDYGCRPMEKCWRTPCWTADFICSTSTLARTT